MKYISVLLIFSLLLIAVKCPKNDVPPQLPPITQSGANTFGCLVNGQVWIPVWGAGSADAPYLVQWGPGSTITIQATKWRKNPSHIDSILQVLYMTLPQHDTGMYYIKNHIKNLSANCLGFKGQYDTVNNNLGFQNWVHISRFDSVPNIIISGTFNFFFTAHGLDTLHITSGRFDMKNPY